MIRLFDYLKKDQIYIIDSFSSKDAIFNFLAEKFEIITGVSKTIIYNGLIKREDSLSTGIGNNIALPHCFLEEVKDLSLVICKSNHLINYNSVDKQPVFLIISIIGNQKSNNKYLNLVSQLISKLRDKSVFDKIFSIKDSESLYEFFLNT